MLAAVLLALAAAGTTSFQSQGQPPSVVVIVMDDVGQPERGLVPSLDRIASSGVEFQRFYSYPVCCTARLAMFSGRYPRREGIGNLELDAHSTTGKRLPLSLLSTFEVFKVEGYRTALFGKWHLGRAPLNGEMNQLTSGPFCQGIDTWRAGSPTGIQSGSGATGYYNWWRVEGGDAFLSGGYATDVQRDRFIDWWTTTPGPRYAWLAWSAAHNNDSGQLDLLYEPPPGDSPTGSVRGDYEQVVRYLDRQIDAVLDVVDLASTYVVILGDNGTPEDARPLGSDQWTHKFTTYEGGVRVPFVIAGPGIERGAVTNRLASAVDLPATLAELAGVPITAGFEDSQSFADELGLWPGSPARSFVFAEVYRPGYDDQAVIERLWKLRRVLSSTSLPGPTGDHWYRITGPGEEVPLVPSKATQARLVRELESLPARAP